MTRTGPAGGARRTATRSPHGLQVVSIVSAEVGWYAEDEAKHVWAVVPDRTPDGLAELLQA